MINNTQFSQIHIIQQHQAKHKRRLQKILQSRPPMDQYTLNHNFANMLESKKTNHEKWKQYKLNRQKFQILQHNQKLFNRLMDISTENGPYAQQKVKGFSPQNQLNRSQIQSPQKNDESHNISANDSKISGSSSRFRSSSLHHNYQVQNSKKTKIINQQNQSFAQRLMKQTGYYSQKKDAEDFRKTREILNRIQRFDQMKRVMKNMQDRQLKGTSQVKFRSKTLPSNTKRTENLNKQGTVENGQISKQNAVNKYHFNKFIEKRYKTIQQIKEQTQKGSQQVKQTNRRSSQHTNLKLNKSNKIQLNKLPNNNINKSEGQIDDQADKLMKKYLNSQQQK